MNPVKTTKSVSSDYSVCQKAGIEPEVEAVEATIRISSVYVVLVLVHENYAVPRAGIIAASDGKLAFAA
jgi:hypothetical protein